MTFRGRRATLNRARSLDNGSLGQLATEDDKPIRHLFNGRMLRRRGLSILFRLNCRSFNS